MDGGGGAWTSEVGSNSNMQMQNIYYDFSRIVEGTAQAGTTALDALPPVMPAQPCPGAPVLEPLHKAWEPRPSQQLEDRSWLLPLPEDKVRPGSSFLQPKSASSISTDRNLIWLFTIMLLAVFVAPTLQLLRVAGDRSVQYFLGSWTNLVGLIPLTCFAGHTIHIVLGRPHKYTIVVCLLLPAVILLVIADILIWEVSTKADELFSTDCDALASKRELDRARDAAERVYQTCLVDTLISEPAIKSNLTLSQAMQLYRIVDCEEYEFEFQRHGLHWQYLSWLEEKYQCAGWCEFTAPLWTHKEVQDSCSVAVSSVFSAKIKYMSWQVVIYTVITMTTACGILLAVRKRMEQAEQDNM